MIQLLDQYYSQVTIIWSLHSYFVMTHQLASMKSSCDSYATVIWRDYCKFTMLVVLWWVPKLQQNVVLMICPKEALLMTSQQSFQMSITWNHNVTLDDSSECTLVTIYYIKVMSLRLAILDWIVLICYTLCLYHFILSSRH